MSAKSRKDEPKRTQDPEGTRREILAVAMAEFGRHGYGGARVDRIAEATRTSKRMLYYYYGGKEGLYLSVLEEAYRRIRAAEAGLDLAAKEPGAALEELIRFTVDYHYDNGAYVNLIMNENISRGAHVEKSNLVGEFNSRIIGIVGDILDRGKAAGLFRADADPYDLHLLISALSFFPAANRYTFSKIFDYDLVSPEAREKRKRELTRVAMDYLRPA